MESILSLRLSIRWNTLTNRQFSNKRPCHCSHESLFVPSALWSWRLNLTPHTCFHWRTFQLMNHFIWSKENSVFLLQSLLRCFYVKCFKKINEIEHLEHMNLIVYIFFKNYFSYTISGLQFLLPSLHERAGIPEISTKHGISNCNKTRYLPSY